MIDSASTFRLGSSSLSDTLAAWWHLIVSDPRRQLSSPRKLKVARYVDFDAFPRILEIGPSTGVVTTASLCRLRQNVTVFDLWAYYRQWRILQRRNPRLKFVLGDAVRPLPFAPASFDCCIYMAALSYVPTPHLTLAEVGRVLRPRGWFFISSTRRPADNRAHELHRLDLSQPTFWNRDELNAALDAAGFDVLETYDYVIYPSRLYGAYRTVSKFRYSEALHKALVARHPNKEIFACSIARKRVG
jgi:SAM-dependent methyltransferase